VKSFRRIATTAAVAVLAAGGLVSASSTSAQASVGVCYLKSYKNPKFNETLLVPEYTLKLGMHDYCVVGLQTQINRRYNDVLDEDGIFGPQTQRWVRRIQEDYWCAGGVDGIAGPNTISCFEHVNGISIWP